MLFRSKGSGAIIFVGDIAVKASSVDRAFSMGKLCKRLGDFEEGGTSGAAATAAVCPAVSDAAPPRLLPEQPDMATAVIMLATISVMVSREICIWSPIRK